MKLQTITLGMLLVVTACSRDEKEYRSTLPEFSELKVENLSRDSKNLYVGDAFRITAVQSKRGSLLNRATYTWTMRPSTLTHTETKIYDRQSDNPSWTGTADTQGACTIVMTGEYGISGTGVASLSKSLQTTDGSVVNYTVNPLTSRIVVQKSVTVYPRP